MSGEAKPWIKCTICKAEGVKSHFALLDQHPWMITAHNECWHCWKGRQTTLRDF